VIFIKIRSVQIVQDFYKYLCSGPDAPWPLVDRFCLWGFVAALIIRARHLMGSSDLEDRRSAEIDFGYATTVLGKAPSDGKLDVDLDLGTKISIDIE
jgi:hypothetical protein